MGWLVPFPELTDAQRRAVLLSPELHRVFAGPPGSGKTMVLLHRAANLRDAFGIDPARLQVFVFTNTLKSYIRSELGLLRLPDSCVSTFDSWCLRFFHAVVRGRVPMDDDETDYPRLRATAAAWLREHPLRHRPFDAVLVDEGQDLDGSTFEILRSVASHVTVCTDSRQQLYDTGSSETEIAGWLGLGQRNVSFLDAFRCVPLVSRLASLYIAEPEERERFLRQVRAEQGERELPLLFVARSAAEERGRLVQVLRTRLARGERVAILVPSKRMMGRIQRACGEAGLTLETSPHLRFTSLVPKLLTYHGGKGLVFDSVLLPGIEQGAFRHGDASAWLRLLFVGITRARRWVYLSTQSASTDVYSPLRRLLGPDAAGCCEVQWGAGGPVQTGLFEQAPAPPRAEGRVDLPPTPDDDLTDLL